MNEPVRVLGVVGHPRYAGMSSAVGELASFARERGLDLQAESDLLPFLPGASRLDPGALDLLVTLGGDGTLLRGARLVASHGTRVVGVNLGHLGFLTSLSPDALREGMSEIVAGDYWVDARGTLEATLSGAPEERHLALNDVVLHLAGMARLIRLAVYVGEGAEREHVGSYSADGLILATPTGSTAYSLSAGGPIVSPGMDCILATPISPHSLTIRPLVMPASSVVTVEVLSPERPVTLTADGQESAEVPPGQAVLVRTGSTPVRLVRFAGQRFFSRLREKLHWATPQHPSRTAAEDMATPSGPAEDAP